MYIDDRGRTVLQSVQEIHDFKTKMIRLRENRKLQGRKTFQNIPISVENRKGSVRKGEDEDGEEWRTKMKVPYGYIPGTEGVDGDALDVFVGPDENAPFAYIVHCNTPDGEKFDEDKVMLGFQSSQAAKQCFLQHYDDPKFFGGIDSIPMWKFRERAFVKKHTTKKLVASMRESEGAWLQLPKDVFAKPEYEAEDFAPSVSVAGRGTDQDMRRSILGHHQDVMEQPEVREAQEHGVKGMKWGVRHDRNKAQSDRRRGIKPSPLQRRNLASDPKSLSQMEVVHRSQEELNQIANQQIAHVGQSTTPAQPGVGQFGERPTSPEQNQKQLENNHGEALNALKELGWRALGTAANLTGMGGAFQAVQSVVRSPAGQKLFLNTDRQGSHKLTTDKEGRVPASKSHAVRRTRTSRAFESRMGSFLREARTYYARPLSHYGTDVEESDVDLIQESFPNDKVSFPKTRRHAELGMGYFHEKIDKAKRFVMRPKKGRRITAGVFSEATHALKKKIPVYAIHKGNLRRVKSVEALGNPNKHGHFGRIKFFKKKSKS